MITQVENPILEVHNLTISYERKPVLWNVDFSLPEGKIIGVIGPNGSGKTTLLKAIMGLVEIETGYIKIAGNDLDFARNKISYVPQRESVDWDFPASVYEIALMGRYTKKNIFGILTAQDKTITMDAIEKVGLKDFAKRQISQLSGGQQQRVFLARSIAQNADIYIMDEPFSAVDAATEDAILNLLISLKNQGKTIIIVHHDIQTAKSYFDWIVLLNTRLVASADKDFIFNSDLIQQAYGGRLKAMSDVEQLLTNKPISIR